MCVYAFFVLYVLCAGAERKGLRPWSKLLDIKQSAVWNVAATGVILLLEYGPRRRGRTRGKEHFYTLKMDTTLGDWGLPSHRSEQATQGFCSHRVQFSVSSQPGPHLATKQDSQRALFNF